MMAAPAPTIHASAVLVGAEAALIRGPAGSGKSRLVWDLVTAASQGILPFARLVADDRAHVESHSGRLLVRPAPALAGMIEVHGLGIRRIEFESVAAVGLIIDLAAEDAAIVAVTSNAARWTESRASGRQGRYCRDHCSAACGRSRDGSAASGVSPFTNPSDG